MLQQSKIFFAFLIKNILAILSPFYTAWHSQLCICFTGKCFPSKFSARMKLGVCLEQCAESRQEGFVTKAS